MSFFLALTFLFTPLEAKALVANWEVVQAIERYFKDTPVIARVAYCESRFRQNAVSPTADFGVLQVNKMHEEQAKELGHDIHTLEGNLGFSRYLYDTQGLQPWSASKKCWSATPPLPSLHSPTSSHTQDTSRP
jgi:hypothetical protein